jgi:hypothetical protein
LVGVVISHLMTAGRHRWSKGGRHGEVIDKELSEQQ